MQRERQHSSSAKRPNHIGGWRYSEWPNSASPTRSSPGGGFQKEPCTKIVSWTPATKTRPQGCFASALKFSPTWQTTRTGGTKITCPLHSATRSGCSLASHLLAECLILDTGMRQHGADRGSYRQAKRGKHQRLALKPACAPMPRDRSAKLWALPATLSVAPAKVCLAESAASLWGVATRPMARRGTT
jgi:hypothetical protein